MRFVPALVLASSFLGLPLLAGCGDDDNGSPSGSSGGGGASDSALVTQLSACPVVSNSQDPAASACLVGSYTGKTLAGEACSLVIKAGGAYDFTSPSLSHQYVPTDKTIRVFTHSSSADTHFLGWRLSDPVQTTAAYDLKFDAQFGAYAEEANRKISIEVTKNLEGATSSSCVVAL